MALRPLHPLLLVSLAALLLCCSSASPSSRYTGDELNGTRTSVPRRHLAPRSSAHSSSSSSSSSSALPLAPPHRNLREAKHAVLWYVELLGGVVSGVAVGALVTVALLSSDEVGEKKIPVVFGYTILDPELLWAEELCSLFCSKELALQTLEVIGRGACGQVYKAEMPNSDGAFVAIKRVDHLPAIGTAELCRQDKHLLDKAARQVRSEIMTAGFLRHPNILPVLAHVYRNDRHYLVYEYMRNGSLHDALKGAAMGTRELSWPARFKIARGIAAGLEYLHVVHRPVVIHRDLKPANILLDDDMEARISDFGLAKEAADLDDTLTTSNVAGTIGYIAPEYYQVMRITDKCDVYSFGVILAALVTGRLPTDRFFQATDEMSLVGWMRSAMKAEDPVAAAADTMLLGNGYEVQMVLALKIACFCTYDNPRHRPSIRDARCMLSQIKHQA